MTSEKAESDAITEDERYAIWERGAVLAQRADWEREQVEEVRRG